MIECFKSFVSATDSVALKVGASLSSTQTRSGRLVRVDVNLKMTLRVDPSGSNLKSRWRSIRLDSEPLDSLGPPPRAPGRAGPAGGGSAGDSAHDSELRGSVTMIRHREFRLGVKLAGAHWRSSHGSSDRVTGRHSVAHSTSGQVRSGLSSCHCCAVYYSAKVSDHDERHKAAYAASEAPSLEI